MKQNTAQSSSQIRIWIQKNILVEISGEKQFFKLFFFLSAVGEVNHHLFSVYIFGGYLLPHSLSSNNIYAQIRERTIFVQIAYIYSNIFLHHFKKKEKKKRKKKEGGASKGSLSISQQGVSINTDFFFLINSDPRTQGTKAKWWINIWKIKAADISLPSWPPVLQVLLPTTATYIFPSGHNTEFDHWIKMTIPERNFLHSVNHKKVEGDGGGPPPIFKKILFNCSSHGHLFFFFKEKVLIYSLVLLLNWIRKHVSLQNSTLRKMPIIILKCKFLRPPEPDYVWHRIIS